MENVNSTVVEFANVDFVAELIGDLDAEHVRDMLSDTYQFLENAVYTESYDPELEQKRIIFSEKLGDKGQF
jgi:hypothetical protein